MDIWISWAKRDSKCKYCEETILPGTPVVIGKMWNPGKWSYKIRWHPQCWITQGMNYLEKNPFTTRRLKLEDEQRERRLYLIRRYAVCKYRLQSAANTGSIRTVKSLVEKMEAIRAEIIPLGGVPKSWESLTSIVEILQ